MKLSKNIITIHTETNIGICVEERSAGVGVLGGGGGVGASSSFGLYREAPPERALYHFHVSGI